MRVPALHDNQRAVLFRWGMLAVSASCALGPLWGESAVQNAGGALQQPLPTEVVPPISSSAPVALTRDPFIPQATELPENVLVRAVVLGAMPHALLGVGAQTMLVGIGDEVGGLRVVAIDESGVRLSDGTLIRFDAGGL